MSGAESNFVGFKKTSFFVLLQILRNQKINYLSNDGMFNLDVKAIYKCKGFPVVNYLENNKYRDIVFLKGAIFLSIYNKLSKKLGRLEN